MLTGSPSIWRRLLWLLLTGDVRSPLRFIPEHRPFLVIRSGQRLDVQPVPTQANHRTPVRFAAGKPVRLLHCGRSVGTVVYHAPDDRVWVHRPGATVDVFFYPYELEEAI